MYILLSYRSMSLAYCMHLDLHLRIDDLIYLCIRVSSWLLFSSSEPKPKVDLSFSSLVSHIIFAAYPTVILIILFLLGSYMKYLHSLLSILLFIFDLDIFISRVFLIEINLEYNRTMFLPNYALFIIHIFTCIWTTQFVLH